MNSTAASFSPPRVQPNQKHAFAGILRLAWSRFMTPGHWFGLLASLAVLALLASATRPGSEDGHYVRWLGEFYVVAVVPIFAFIFAGGAMRDDVKAGSVDYLLTRPVLRPALVGFRFVAHQLALQFDFMCALGLLVAIGVGLHAPGIISALPMLVLAQVAMIFAFGAFGFFCAAATSRFIIVGLCYAGIVEVGIGNIPTQLSRLSMTHLARDLLRGPMGALGEPALGPVMSVAVLLGFSAVMLVSAAAIFSFREWAASQAREG
jgi:ABC-2 type transport system permease protein